MHGDHIGGLLMEDGSPTFANARYVTGQVEYDAWAKLGNERFDQKVRPVGFPDWEVKFDQDKAAAAQTRKALFGMLAADRVPFVGFHMPFPGLGYVEARPDDRFHYVPVSYQLML